MQCPSCHAVNSEESQYCSKCGMPLVDIKDTVTHTTPIQPPKEDTLQFAPGESFGRRYKIIEEVGRGGMGRVYKAEDKELGITVALKMIHPEYSAKSHIVDRFKKETLLARSISHENVIRIYDIGEVERVKFISMDYIKGQSLKDLILTSGTLTVDTAINITKQICQALMVANQKGIVHRDLKPQNILVDSSGKAYVTDFGVAKSVEVMEDSVPGLIIGTIQYISPEQAKGEKADTRSDLYSLGIIMYEMLTGKKPFHAETYTGYIQKHIHERPSAPSKINPNIPPYLEKIILKCLEKAKEFRYQNAEEILRDLETERVATRPILSRIRVKKFSKFITAGILVLLFIIVAYLWITRKPQVPPPPQDTSIVMVAIMPFENNTGDKNLEHIQRILHDSMIHDLHQSRFIRALSQDRIFQILQKMRPQDTDQYTSELLDRIASETNVHYFILGGYAKIGEDFWINARIQDAWTHEIKSIEEIHGRGVESLTSIVDDFTRRLKPIFGLTQTEIAQDVDRDIGTITTGSQEAYRYYIDARQLFTQRKFKESINLLEKAIQIDPKFAMAYLEISSAYVYLSQHDKAEEYLLKVLDFEDRISDRERYLLLGDVSNLLHNSPKKAIEHYKKILELYPNDEEAHLLIAAMYRNIEEWDLAIGQCEKVLLINENAEVAYNNLSLLYMAKGAYDKALEVIVSHKDLYTHPDFVPKFKCYAFFGMGKYELALVEAGNLLASNPTNPDYIRLKGNLYHAQEDFQEAEKIYKELSTTDDPLIQSEATLWMAQLYLIQGRVEKCREEIRTGIGHSQDSGLLEHELKFLLLHTYLNLQYENLLKALDAANKAMEIALQNRLTDDQKLTLHLRGLIHTKMNRMEEAEKNAEQLKELIERTDNEKHMRHYYHLMGMIALKTGKISDSIAHFEQAVSLLPGQVFHLRDHALYMDSLASSYYVNGDIEKSIQQYEKIQSLTISKLQWGDIYARSHYWLGKRYQDKGWEGKALEQYGKFLKLWRLSDTGSPEIADAKNQMTELTNNSSE